MSNASEGDKNSIHVVIDRSKVTFRHPDPNSSQFRHGHHKTAHYGLLTVKHKSEETSTAADGSHFTDSTTDSDAEYKRISSTSQRGHGFAGIPSLVTMTASAGRWSRKMEMLP